MSVITISRGCYSKGKEVAEKLAEKPGYECIFKEIILEASEHFHVIMKNLKQAIHDPHSFLEHITYDKEIDLCYISEVLLEHIEKDNVVYHGLTGPFFLKTPCYESSYCCQF